VGTEGLQALPFIQRSAEAADLGYNLFGIALGLAVVALFRGVGAWWGRRGASGGADEGRP
jgi:hypothetical protein